jgi:hypothetical protein
MFKNPFNRKIRDWDLFSVQNINERFKHIEEYLEEESKKVSTPQEIFEVGSRHYEKVLRRNWSTRLDFKDITASRPAVGAVIYFLTSNNPRPEIISIGTVKRLLIELTEKDSSLIEIEIISYDSGDPYTYKNITLWGIKEW